MWRCVLGLAICSTLLVPVTAAANDCQPVADAYNALGKVPAYKQTVVLNGKPLAEFIVVGDRLYTKRESGWTAVDLGAGGRAATQKKVIPDAASLKGCARIGDDKVAGKDAVIYAYTPPPMEGGLDLGPQRVWIGTADGLPLRMTSEQAKTDVTLSFDNVTAPVP
ncbi:hypothetical protein [Rhizobium sp. AG855]|uniref:hypothetical protein n=1 Tax=Rhizobium sp. AG855 TaxID=2183898 RepID=UPI000E73590E|nr:hypothetical protein [Rhizobium sp. AG855]RKE77406.1 hypothetical protein DFO46_4631 [Rhizobium sp. AG855]